MDRIRNLQNCAVRFRRCDHVPPFRYACTCSEADLKKNWIKIVHHSPDVAKRDDNDDPGIKGSPLSKRCIKLNLRFFVAGFFGSLRESRFQESSHHQRHIPDAPLRGSYVMCRKVGCSTIQLADTTCHLSTAEACLVLKKDSLFSPPTTPPTIRMTTKSLLLQAEDHTRRIHQRPSHRAVSGALMKGLRRVGLVQSTQKSLHLHFPSDSWRALEGQQSVCLPSCRFPAVLHFRPTSDIPDDTFFTFQFTDEVAATCVVRCPYLVTKPVVCLPQNVVCGQVGGSGRQAGNDDSWRRDEGGERSDDVMMGHLTVIAFKATAAASKSASDCLPLQLPYSIKIGDTTTGRYNSSVDAATFHVQTCFPHSALFQSAAVKCGAGHTDNSRAVLSRVPVTTRVLLLILFIGIMTSSEDEGDVDKKLVADRELFVKILSENTVLLEKSRVPKVLLEKKKAWETLCSTYSQTTGNEVNATQMNKMLQNMKTKIKKKSDVKATGNKKIKLREWEKMLLALLGEAENPVFTKVPGSFAAGACQSTSVEATRNDSSDEWKNLAAARVTK
ncbi:hypothetical protein J6590_077071 [Homalodisca vitripennis]|nr:hypothetical protein J6590_077071 [Homalodisca vitripennis]